MGFALERRCGVKVKVRVMHRTSKERSPLLPNELPPRAPMGLTKLVQAVIFFASSGTPKKNHFYFLLLRPIGCLIMLSSLFACLVAVKCSSFRYDDKCLHASEERKETVHSPTSQVTRDREPKVAEPIRERLIHTKNQWRVSKKTARETIQPFLSIRLQNSTGFPKFGSILVCISSYLSILCILCILVYRQSIQPLYSNWFSKF